MKFMLLMTAPRGTGDWGIFEWSKAAIDAHMKHMMGINDDLRRSGELVGGEGLTPPKDARIVRAGANGQPQVTDGPFAETKEFLAGFWVIEAADLDVALELAAGGSKACYRKIEVRPFDGIA